MDKKPGVRLHGEFGLRGMPAMGLDKDDNYQILNIVGHPPDAYARVDADGMKLKNGLTHWFPWSRSVVKIQL